MFHRLALLNLPYDTAIPYLWDGQMHDYMPEFVIRRKSDPPVHLILEYDSRDEVKGAAAHTWVGSVNAEGIYGQ